MAGLTPEPGKTMPSRRAVDWILDELWAQSAADPALRADVAELLHDLTKGGQAYVETDELLFLRARIGGHMPAVWTRAKVPTTPPGRRGEEPRGIIFD